MVKGNQCQSCLERLDIENTATGFIGGFTGRFIEDVLTSEAISTNFVTVDQDTRINVKIKADQETEINGNGPEVTEAQLQELLSILSSLTADDVVVLCRICPIFTWKCRLQTIDRSNSCDRCTSRLRL